MATILTLACASVLGAPAAGAQEGDEERTPELDVVQLVEVSGLLDPVMVEFISTEVERAEDDGLVAVILQMNSPGKAVPDDRFVDLARQLRDSSVPVAIWVGPSGSQARGAAAQLVGMLPPDRRAISIGSRIGDTGRQILPVDEFGVLWGDDASRLESTFVRRDDAADVGLVDAPTLGDFYVELDGVNTREVSQGGERRVEPVTQPRFVSLSIAEELAHTVASPNVAYLLLSIGLGLIVFELFTAGIGIAGAVGAGSLVLGSYGLWVLPTRPIGIALLVLSFLAFAVDVQTGVPRFWTGAGGLLFVAGTFLLYDGVSLSWITMLVAFVAVALTFLSGMPTMVRTRFSTPTIGREWMIGELGLALSDVDPEGTVSIRSAPWRAQTNRATPVAAGDRVKVVGIDGLLLEVEPEEGGARDHRERRGRSAD
ncbi:MAG: NfeD family protein [Actinomycetota bacterium]|nr:NfeD family protein [Actinomycetota bacterium]